jgi:CrcB protein
MLNWVLIAVGGAIGSVGRYGLARLSALYLPMGGWPYGTFMANVLGGLLMGVLMAVVIRSPAPMEVERLRLFVGVGILGGFTTFSTFSLEVVQMLERRDYVLASSYALLSVLLAVGAVIVGLYLTRKFVF